MTSTVHAYNTTGAVKRLCQRGTVSLGHYGSLHARLAEEERARRGIELVLLHHMPTSGLCIDVELDASGLGTAKVPRTRERQCLPQAE